MKNVLSIAGSDPSGGAGIQADLKTFQALGVRGMAAITSLTAQNQHEVFGVLNTPPEFITAQLEAVFKAHKVDAIKIGMLGNVPAIDVVASQINGRKNIVLDTVMVATSGGLLLERDAIGALKKLILLADIITPNLPEAAALLGAMDTPKNMARGLLDLGARAVLVKGGHGTGDNCDDVFADRDGDIEVFSAPRLAIENAHGTGCTLSSAIAVFLANGENMRDACKSAKDYITRAIKNAKDGMLNHALKQ